MADLAAERRESFLRWMKAMGLNAHRLYKETGLPKMTVSDYVTGETKSLSGEREAIIASRYGYSVDAIFGANDPNLQEVSHITAWRERAEMTIEQLAEAVGTTVQIMEMVEAGELPLIGKRRIAIADALGVTQGFLSIDPLDPENSLVVATIKVPPGRQREAARVLEALAPTGTEG